MCPSRLMAPLKSDQFTPKLLDGCLYRRSASKCGHFNATAALKGKNKLAGRRRHGTFFSKWLSKLQWNVWPDLINSDCRRQRMFFFFFSATLNDYFFHYWLKSFSSIFLRQLYWNTVNHSGGGGKGDQGAVRLLVGLQLRMMGLEPVPSGPCLV